MTKNFIYIIASALLLLTSCFKDNGNYDYHTVDDIVISGLKDSYTEISYKGDTLSILPEIQSDYSDLTYEWYMWSPYEEKHYTGKEPYKAQLIGTEKQLKYLVDCLPGRYTIMLKVKSPSNGYAAMATTQFDATTAFSRGFYILKETADGNTELDQYYKDGEPVIPNLLTAKGFGELPGKPLSVGFLPGYGYTDSITNSSAACHAISVATDKGHISFYTTVDFTKVHDETNAVYGGMGSDELPYAAFGYGYSNYLLTNKGTTLSYCYFLMPSTGTFSTHSSTGSSLHLMSNGGNYVCYWNPVARKFDYTDDTWMGHLGGDYDDNGFPTDGLDCVACGASQAVTPVSGYWLMKDAAGHQSIYISDLTNEKAPKTTGKVDIPASSKLAGATAYAFNALTSNYLYFIYNNQLYDYNLTDFSESAEPLPLPGLPSDETITYLSYQFQNVAADEDNNFTYLVVGTQKGDTYHVYMYTLRVGEPDKLVRQFSGNGKLKMVTYATPVDYANSGKDRNSLPGN